MTAVHYPYMHNAHALEGKTGQQYTTSICMARQDSRTQPVYAQSNTGVQDAFLQHVVCKPACPYDGIPDRPHAHTPAKPCMHACMHAAQHARACA
eukprot:365650-Chlamydomonas_euryale.AAC.19